VGKCSQIDNYQETQILVFRWKVTENATQTERERERERERKTLTWKGTVEVGGSESTRRVGSKGFQLERSERLDSESVLSNPGRTRGDTTVGRWQKRELFSQLSLFLCALSDESSQSA